MWFFCCCSLLPLCSLCDLQLNTASIINKSQNDLTFIFFIIFETRYYLYTLRDTFTVVTAAQVLKCDHFECYGHNHRATFILPLKRIYFDIFAALFLFRFFLFSGLGLLILVLSLLALCCCKKSSSKHFYVYVYIYIYSALKFVKFKVFWQILQPEKEN